MSFGFLKIEKKPQMTIFTPMWEAPDSDAKSREWCRKVTN